MDILVLENIRLLGIQPSFCLYSSGSCLAVNPTFSYYWYKLLKMMPTPVHMRELCLRFELLYL
jgi:hypothetical protein